MLRDTELGHMCEGLGRICSIDCNAVRVSDLRFKARRVCTVARFATPVHSFNISLPLAPVLAASQLVQTHTTPGRCFAQNVPRMLSRLAALTIATLHCQLVSQVRWTPIAKACDADPAPDCINCAQTGLPLLRLQCCAALPPCALRTRTAGALALRTA